MVSTSLDAFIAGIIASNNNSPTTTCTINVVIKHDPKIRSR